MTRLPGLLPHFLAFLLTAPAGADSATASTPERMRGFVVTCPGWGPVWGSPAMAESLAEITDLGANWIAIHPYGWIRRDGSVEYRPAASLDFLTAAVELARKAGLGMFWKPHLGYWGEFSWRGAIDFGDEETAWRRFFADYRDFITDQAAFAERHGVPLLAIGVETEGTTHREREWRQIVAAVRRVYSGRILYAANWHSLDQVPFWDAVDVIGVHAYFPLAGDGDHLPERARLEAAWDRPLATLADLASHYGKPVVLAEIGYNLSSRAAVEPWAYEVEDSAAARSLRERLIEVAIERLEAVPFIEGMFWWKWMPGWGHHERSNFSMRSPEARRAVARYWAAEAPRSPVSTAE